MFLAKKMKNGSDTMPDPSVLTHKCLTLVSFMLQIDAKIPKGVSSPRDYMII